MRKTEYVKPNNCDECIYAEHNANHEAVIFCWWKKKYKSANSNPCGDGKKEKEN